MADTTLQNGQVVTTTTQDLATFVAQKQQELDMLTQQITLLSARQQQILTDLQALITPQQ